MIDYWKNWLRRISWHGSPEPCSERQRHGSGEPCHVTILRAICVLCICLTGCTGLLSEKRLDRFEGAVKISERVYTAWVAHIDLVMEQLPDGDKKAKLEAFRKTLTEFEGDYLEVRRRWPEVRALIESADE